MAFWRRVLSVQHLWLLASFCSPTALSIEYDQENDGSAKNASVKYFFVKKLDAREEALIPCASAIRGIAGFAGGAPSPFDSYWYWYVIDNNIVCLYDWQTEVTLRVASCHERLVRAKRDTWRFCAVARAFREGQNILKGRGRGRVRTSAIDRVPACLLAKEWSTSVYLIYFEYGPVTSNSYYWYNEALRVLRTVDIIYIIGATRGQESAIHHCTYVL